ncbi:MAG: hypothetical protein MAG431_01566 [Chloroflexi bacterium]|nr:hypothetical protein [Chloroflexota bacterium]
MCEKRSILSLLALYHRRNLISIFLTCLTPNLHLLTPSPAPIYQSPIPQSTNLHIKIQLHFIGMGTRTHWLNLFLTFMLDPILNQLFAEDISG